MTDILDPKYKHCWNCKYRCSQDYGKDLCKSPDLVHIKTTTGGSLYKEHPQCDEVLIWKGKFELTKCEPCKHFKQGFWFKVEQKFSTIQKWYYKKRHPEWFL